QAQSDYDKGKVLFKLMNQSIGEIYTFTEQQFLMHMVLESKPEEIIDVAKLKELVHEYAPKLEEDKDLNGNFDELVAELKEKVVTIDEVKKAALEKQVRIEAEKARQAEEAARAAKEAQAPVEEVEEEKK